MKIATIALFLLFTRVSVVSASGSSFTLDDFISQAKEQSLEFKVEESKNDAAQEKSIGISLPPPMLGVNKMKMNDGSNETANGIEISQTIPFPTKIYSDYKMRQLEASSADETFKSKKLELIAQIKNLYLEYWQIFESKKTMQEKKMILKEHLKLAQAAVRSDTSMKVHFLKAEADADQLESELLKTEHDFLNTQFKINSFLNRDPETEVGDPVEPLRSKIPKNVSFENHTLKAMAFEAQAYKSKESYAKSSWLPDFTFRYKDMSGTSTWPKNSELMVSIDLPFLYFWEPDSQVKSARAESLQAELNLRKANTQQRGEVSHLKLEAESLEKQIDLLEKKLLPNAQKRMALIHNIAPRDMESLQDHRETMELVPDLKKKRVDLIAQYEKIVSQLALYSTEDSHE